MINQQVLVGMSLRTYLDAAFKDGKAPIDPSILVRKMLLACLNFFNFLIPCSERSKKLRTQEEKIFPSFLSIWLFFV